LGSNVSPNRSLRIGSPTSTRPKLLVADAMVGL
jgi:hypothetical protein